MRALFLFSGQSRYHYYGLRVSPKSTLQVGTTLEEGALRSQPGTNKRYVASLFFLYSILGLSFNAVL